MQLRTRLRSIFWQPSRTFHSGEGLTDHYISCAADPYDPEPVAACLFDRLVALDKSTPQDSGPIVILMGEDHTLPMTVAGFPVALLQKMEECWPGRTLAAMEQPHNFLTRIMTALSDETIPGDLIYRTGKYDPDGQAVLSGYMGGWPSGMAPVAHHNLMAWCYHNRVSTLFNDAAMEDDFSLDFRDPLTRAVAGGDRGRAHAEDPDGMAIRNTVMERLGVWRARTLKKRFILQSTGRNHVFGNTLDGDAFEDSLHEAYLRAGAAAVLPFFPVIRSDAYSVNRLSAAALSALRGAVIADAFSEKRFYARWYVEQQREKGIILPFEDGAEWEDVQRIKLGPRGHFNVAVNEAAYGDLCRDHVREVLARYKADWPKAYAFPAAACG